MAPRSRLPVSPSMEARLSTSHESLASSTGSNHELKTQLDSTLAEVEAIAKHLEKQKKTPLEKSVSTEAVLRKSSSKPSVTDLPKPMIRRKTSEQISAASTASRTLPSSNGARPRERVSLTGLVGGSTPDPAPRSSVSSDFSKLHFKVFCFILKAEKNE